MWEKARTAWIDPLFLVLDVAPSRSHKVDWTRLAGLERFGEGRLLLFLWIPPFRLLLL
ncbi:hypothetical protein R3W88_002613 [Solanum pinnatisectum]|uniref:Uncharacterized protein n=1 Tax=Solanum pinnatisectum TaxID=50273 RepID=A0AAV9MME3_9SOLN|nr:hypothetical protein R3W88_002613 [Solanum pinnatisectum]